MQPNQSTTETEAGRTAALVGTGDLLASDVFSKFKTYREARERQVVLEGRRRKGSFGIAVDKDEEAVEWQSRSRPAASPHRHA